MSEKPKILLVDDEPSVLSALSRQLHRQFDVHTAPGGEEALALLAKDGSFSAIVSDMRMPGMNGAELLAKARELSPHTVRLLLTGFGDFEVAMAAVNQGAVFRFLSKPCPTDALILSLNAAVEQHRLLTAERELLALTLRGAVEALVETLSLAQPLAFGRSVRWKQIVVELTALLCPRDSWPVEVAAMVSQLGAAALPTSVLERLYRGEPLTPDQREMVQRTPALTDALIAHLPRLDAVREILRDRVKPWAQVVIGARILRVVEDYDSLVSSGRTAGEALQILRSRDQAYDPAVLAAVERAFVGSIEAPTQVRELLTHELRVGMVLHADVCARNGMLLVTRGHTVTVGLIERLRNFVRVGIREPILVADPSKAI